MSRNQDFAPVNESAYREEGILILSGGLTIHNLRDFTSFSESSAKPIYKEFDKAIVAAADVKDVRFSFV